MDPAEMKLFQENVEEFVMDENKLVTFKYLACTLQIPIDSAKRILREYVFPGGKRRAEVNLTYVLGGHLPDNQGYKIALVRESDVPEVEKRFVSVEVKEIFCVHKVASVLDLNVIYGIDGNLHNVKPRVTCKNAVQRAQRTPPAPPVSAPKPLVKTVPSATVKQVAKEPELPSVASAKPAMASIFGSAVPKKSPAVNSNAAKLKKGGGIASFFPKHDKVVPISKPLDPVKVESPEKEPSKVIKSEPLKTVAAASSSKENSPENKSPPRSAKSSQKKKTKRASKEPVVSKQRRRIKVMSESESSAGEESEAEERCPSPEAPPPDFRGESSDEEVVPATPNAGSGGRKKVLRVKTTMDDEGYVVTSKEWVWEGEEEEEGEKDKGKKGGVGNNHKISDQKKTGNDIKETVKPSRKSKIEEMMESEDEDKEEQKEMPKKQTPGKKVKLEEEETPVKNKKGQMLKPNEKEKVDATAEKAKAAETKKKESKAQAKKKEGSNSDKSEAKTSEKKVTTKPTDNGQDAKQVGSKRKLIDVASSEDESQEKPKAAAQAAAKRQPAKKQPPKKKSPPKGSGTQTNIMAFFGKK